MNYRSAMVFTPDTTFTYQGGETKESLGWLLDNLVANNIRIDKVITIDENNTMLDWPRAMIPKKIKNRYEVEIHEQG